MRMISTCIYRCLFLILIGVLCDVSLDPIFENMLRKHHLDDETIQILGKQKLLDIAAVRGLTEDDMRDLGLPVGQRVLLRELVIKLRASSGDVQQQPRKEEPVSNSAPEQTNGLYGKDLRRKEKYEGEDEDNTDQMTKGQDTSNRKGNTNDEKKMSEKQFWCIFKCLGGISAVGIGGILALIGLVTYGLPVIGFGAVGIAAGSLAAKIMSLYGGAVAAGSVVSVLQSVAMAGIGWKAILGAFFGPAAVMAAVKKTCTHCMDL